VDRGEKPLTGARARGSLAAMPCRILLPGFLLSVALACGKEGGGDSSDGASSSGTATTVDATGGSSSSTGLPTTGGTTTGETTTGVVTTSGDTTGAGSTTGVDFSGFERFTMNTAAGPCPPDFDCDGFIEVLASGLLRVETFGEVGDPVKEAQLSPEDLAAAVPVFADPALIALLDGPDPACSAPADVFESMTVVVDAVAHDTSTAFCDQPPIVAARELAEALSVKYLP
jgi:hypothetical protein